MALLHNSSTKFCKARDLFKLCSAFVHQKSDLSYPILEDLQESRKEDMPVEIENPFKTEKPKCILCKYDIEPNFKNVRLLSQFVSTFTGRIYGRHITGLCKYKQTKLEKEIKKAQEAAMMGHCVKDPNFIADPDLYDASKPFRVL